MLSMESEAFHEVPGEFLVLEHGRVAQDALAYAAEFVLHRGVDGVAVAFAVQCRGEFVPFERELADLFRQRLALGEGVLDQAELVDETAGQDEQPLRSIRPMGSCLTGQNSGCAWKMPSGSSSLTELLRKIRLIS